MSQYSVLFVDDEEEVFRVIMRKLDWESLGFSVAGFARNGEEALEMAEELQPDVVMTDIKMPYMDGLELGRRLKESYQRIRIIIFSGFDEFEYAKEAIKLEVEEYILKPINAGELREVFSRIRRELDRERDEKRNIDKLRQYYMESLPLLQEGFLTSLIEGRIPEEEIAPRLAAYQLSLEGPCYAVILLHISAPDTEEEIAPLLMAAPVKQLAEEQLTERWRTLVFSHLEDVIAIAQLAGAEEMPALNDDLDRFCRLTKRVCGAAVTAGIGHLCRDTGDLPSSYTGAKDAVSYRVLYGNARAINIAEMAPSEESEGTWELRSLQPVLRKIRTGSREEVTAAVDDCIREVSEEGTSLQKYRLFIMEILTEIFRFGGNSRLNMEELFGDVPDVYNEVLRLESAEALENWLLTLALRMQEMLQHERMDTTRSFVARAEDYVREHFADQDLSVEAVCRPLGVSAAYFSTVFKKETGKTFINYLTEYRMQEALWRLLDSDEKTYIIAGEVGYADPNYFSYVFKTQSGTAPSKYRNEKSGKP